MNWTQIFDSARNVATVASAVAAWVALAISAYLGYLTWSQRRISVRCKVVVVKYKKPLLGDFHRKYGLPDRWGVHIDFTNDGRALELSTVALAVDSKKYLVFPNNVTRVPETGHWLETHRTYSAIIDDQTLAEEGIGADVDVVCVFTKCGKKFFYHDGNLAKARGWAKALQQAILSHHAAQLATPASQG